MSDELRVKARLALSRRAAYGSDIDLRSYDWGVKEVFRGYESIPDEVVRRSEEMGVELGSGAGEYVQIDSSVAYAGVRGGLKGLGVTVMSIEDALRRFEWVRNYYWRAVPVDTDKYTAVTELMGRHGYFIYVPPGVKVAEPVYACLFIHSEEAAQAVHNVIIVDDDAELNLVTACSSLPGRSLHIGVSEFYVGRRSKLTFTMIHYWNPATHVRPRAAAVVRDDGLFINYYIHLARVKTLQLFPKAYLKGRGSQAYLTSIVNGLGDADIDVGGGIIFEGEESSGEVISRSVIRDRSHVVMRGVLIGKALSKGHLDCKGLMLTSSGMGEAIPALKSVNELADLTHEASIGSISREELDYLMSKGFTESEATSLIVRGFLEAGIDRLPRRLADYVSSMLDLAAGGG